MFNKEMVFYLRMAPPHKIDLPLVGEVSDLHASIGSGVIAALLVFYILMYKKHDSFNSSYLMNADGSVNENKVRMAIVLISLLVGFAVGYGLRKTVFVA